MPDGLQLHESGHTNGLHHAGFDSLQQVSGSRLHESGQWHVGSGGLLMSKEQRATSPDLFLVCRQHLSEPVARVASELLFWSQCGHNKLRGRKGFYKEDADLASVIGKR
jgi:hypothetical protein